MFGYIRPAQMEWRVRTDMEYRAYYCGLCHALGKVCGPLCRMVLRHDLVAVAATLDALPEKGCTMEKKYCPLKFRKVDAMCGPAMDYAARLHLVLTAGKMLDDTADREKGAALRSVLFAPWRKKARKELPELYEAMQQMLQTQQALEKRNCADPDEAAQPIAEWMGKALRGQEQNGTGESLYYLGYNIGKWIYWLDALDDYEEDGKRNRYNVWRLLEPERKSAAERAVPLLHICEAQADAAWDLLPVKRNREMVENILTMGMPHMVQCIAEGREKHGRRPV